MKIFLFLFLLIFSSVSYAQEEGDVAAPELGEEYTEYAKTKPGKTQRPERSTLEAVLLYLPNRVLDLIDIVRADVGIGPALGAVGRVTKYGQFGYRQMMPLSVRAGLRGRNVPVWIEADNEIGVGPAFSQSRTRETTPAELGVSVDLAIVGASAGVSLDEAVDFLGGIVGFDIKDDDL